MTRATAEKVARLLRECRVTPAGAASVYDVTGDTGPHRVFVVDSDDITCTCPARNGECSHIAAAALLHHALDTARAA